MKSRPKHLRNRFWLLSAGFLLLLSLLLGLGTFQASAEKTYRIKKITPTEKKAWILSGLPYQPTPEKIPVSKLRVMNKITLNTSRQKYSPGKILVKFKPEISAQSSADILKAYQPKTYRLIPKINLYVMQVSEESTVEETLAALKNNPDVLYAEPDYRLRALTTPNDVFFDYQYALYNPGGTLNLPDYPVGKRGADIKATTAWDYVKGDPNLLIAVLDSGIDYNHPDLRNKVISTGKDFVNNDNDAFDDLWHGTHVAGIIAAETNNTEGIAGVAWNCRLLPGKVLSAEGEGDYSWLIEALIWAADYASGQAKVGVINMSLGGDEPSQALENALKYAYEKGIVLVASAGNDGAAGVLYPAAYDQYCLAVGASDYNDAVADFSNYGPEVDVAAPGVWVLSTIPLAFVDPEYYPVPYAYASGTSMSAPHVAGFAALIKSAKPWLTAGEIMKLIKYTPDDIGSSGMDEFAGYGRINTGKALAPYKITKKL